MCSTTPRITPHFLLILSLLLPLSCGRQQNSPPKPPPHQGPSDVTFVVMGDTHFGADRMLGLNKRIVGQINQIAGRDYPAAIGGKVAPLRGVLHCGDITDTGSADSWKQFTEVYGLTGKEGMLKAPIFEVTGNHDQGGAVPDNVRKRHETMPYSWDWDNIHFVALGLYPDADALDWLAKDLSATGPQRPVVIFFHYCLDGSYSDWIKPPEKEAFAKAIRDYNVLAIFHGHYHVGGRYLWEKRDTFLPGSPRHNCHTLLVVRITDAKLTAAWWNWDRAEWIGEPFVKNIVGATTQLAR